jgi:Rrf2 family iron-sulfur cluster assembly transcriptional regulator
MRLSAKAIVDAQRISAYFLPQILLDLKTKGLVESVRGSAGGYQLARPPEEITLGEVLYAIDERPRLTHLPTGHEATPTIAVLQSVWKEVQTEEDRILETTLAELVRRSEADSSLSYQI